MQASHSKTGYIGEDGAIIAPLFSFGRVPLAPSYLTGDGSHMTLWTSILLHVIAVCLNMTANIAFMINSGETASDLLMVSRKQPTFSQPAYNLQLMGRMFPIAGLGNLLACDAHARRSRHGALHGHC